MCWKFDWTYIPKVHGIESSISDRQSYDLVYETVGRFMIRWDCLLPHSNKTKNNFEFWSRAKGLKPMWLRGRNHSVTKAILQICHKLSNYQNQYTQSSHETRKLMTLKFDWTYIPKVHDIESSISDRKLYIWRGNLDKK